MAATEIVGFNFGFDLSKYGGKLFKVEPAMMRVQVNADMPQSEGGRQLAALVDKGFKAEVGKYVLKKEVEYKAILKDLDLKLYKSAAAVKGGIKDAEKWLSEEAKGAQVMIRNAIKTFQTTIKALALEFYKRAAAAVDKKFKTEMSIIRCDAAISILKDLGIIVAAGGIAIIAAIAGGGSTVATAGAAAPTLVAAAPIILASGAVIIKSSINIGKSIAANWPSHKKAIEVLGTSVQELKKAVEYEEAKSKKVKNSEKLGPKEKVKLLLTNTKGKVDAVKKNKAIVETWQIKIWQDQEKFSKILAEMEKHKLNLEKAKPTPAVTEALKGLDASIATAKGNVSQQDRYVDNMKKALEGVSALVNKAENLDAKVLDGVVAKLNVVASDSAVQKIVDYAPDAAKNFSKIVDALTPVLKAVA